MKVAVIGPICKDKNIVGKNIFEQIGGIPYYTGNALFFLGASVSIYGSSALARNEIEKSFACEKLLQIHSRHTIKFINSYLKEDSDVRTQGIYDFGYNAITLDDLKDIGDFDYIILGPLLHNNISRHLIEQLASIGLKIVLASQGLIRYVMNNQIIWKHPENVLNVLSYCDFLFLNEVELKYITNTEHTVDGIDFLLKNGAKNIIVTQGLKGSVVCIKSKNYKIKPFPAHRLADVTGAGDSYMAGFVRALELFDDPLKQGEFAAMIATMSIEEKGPFHHTAKDVYKRLGW
ncbi:carbohydrate kinase family protein [Patescibacteria group bacterium]|nr:carbohydrate kinase family protein [Patescibacteria group bacterium]